MSTHMQEMEDQKFILIDQELNNISFPKTVDLPCFCSVLISSSISVAAHFKLCKLSFV